MKQQIIVFFAIVATLQFCSTTADPVETPKAIEGHEQQSNGQQHPTSPKPKLNMEKVQAVKTLCDVLINSSKVQEAVEKRQLEALKKSEHDKTECHAKPLEHAGSDHTEHKNENEEKHQHNGSISGSEGRQNHEQQENQQEHESGGTNEKEHHHHHHHHHHPQNEEGRTETQHAQ